MKRSHHRGIVVVFAEVARASCTELCALRWRGDELQRCVRKGLGIGRDEACGFLHREASGACTHSDGGQLVRESFEELHRHACFETPWN